MLFGGDDQKKDVSYIENISDDQEIINDESVSESAIEKDVNIPNNILEDQIALIKIQMFQPLILTLRGMIRKFSQMIMSVKLK